MATLFVDKIDPQSGTSLEIGSSGDTITIPSGATITNNGTQTGFGGVNTPAFEATITTEQNPSSGVDTKINFDSEIFDTAGAYDTTNKRFTPGVAGKYFIYCNACFGSNSSSSFQQGYLKTYKNGSLLKKSLTNTTSNYTRYQAMTVGNIIDLDENDYVEMYANITLQSGTVEIRTSESFFGAYKIIE